MAVRICRPVISSAVDFHLSNMTETSLQSMYNFRSTDQLVAAAVRNFGFFVRVLQRQIDVQCK